MLQSGANHLIYHPNPDLSTHVLSGNPDIPPENQITTDVIQPSRISNDNFPQPNHINIVRGRQTGHLYNQINSLVFQQEGLQGDRMLNIPSFHDQIESDIGSNNLDSDERVNNLEHNAENGEENLELEQPSNIEEINTGQEERAVRRVAAGRVLLQFTVNFILIIIYALAYLFIHGAISVVVPFIIFNTCAAIYIMVVIKTKNFSDRADTPGLILSIVNTLTLMVYITVAFLKTKHFEIPLTPFSVLGFGVVFAFCCKSNIDSPDASSKFILTLQRAILWAELLLIGLYVDDKKLSWNAIFVPIYFELLFLAFSSITIISTRILAFVNITRREGVSLSLIFGTVWYILNASYTGVWIFLIVMLVEYLENDEGDLGLALKVGLAHSGLLLLYTLILWRQLCKFQGLEVRSEMLGVEIPQNINNEELIGRQRQSFAFKVSKENKISLVMISSSFYSCLDKHLKKNDKKEIQVLRDKVQKARLEKVRHKLTLNLPHKSENENSTKKRHEDFIAINSGPLSRRLDFSDGDIEMKEIPLPTVKKEENNKPDKDTCAICFDNVPNAVYMNCGHGGICYNCALENWKRTDMCILCRRRISKIFKIVYCKPLKIIKVVESTKKILINK